MVSNCMHRALSSCRVRCPVTVLDAPALNHAPPYLTRNTRANSLRRTITIARPCARASEPLTWPMHLSVYALELARRAARSLSSQHTHAAGNGGQANMTALLCRVLRRR